MTSKEFAKKIGVSQTTVSRALNDSPLVPCEKKADIVKMAMQCGFVLNSQARSLKTNKTGTIGILFPRYFASFSKNIMFTHIYDQVQRELISREYDIMVIYDYSEKQSIPVFERIIKCHKIDGFVNLRPYLSANEVKLITQYTVPCVSIFNARQKNKNLHQIFVDDKCAGFLAGDFFGPQKDYTPVYLARPVTEELSGLRLDGFCEGLDKYRRSIPDKQILTSSVSMDDAYNVVMSKKEWFKKNKFAIFAYNDVIASGALLAFKDIGLAIPDHIQILGMDDIPMASWLHPRLSTLQIPVKDLATEACSLLCRLLEGEKVPIARKNFKPTLILRETTVNSR